MLNQVRSDMESLLGELGDLSARNDELELARDNDRVLMRELEAQMKDYKKKYEQGKTELRSLKGASSPLFLASVKLTPGVQPHHNCSLSNLD